MKYFNNSINKFLSVSILLISTNVFALSEKAEEGKELYLDASCQKCHGDAKDFKGTKNKAKNLNAIATWVSRCDANLETGWFPEEQKSVVEYLNEAHYKYNKN